MFDTLLSLFLSEKAKAYEDADTFNMSVGSMSNESSYSIDVSKHGSRRSARRLSPINSKSSHSINKSVKANVIQPDQSVNFKTNSPVDAVRPLVSKPPGSPHSMKSYVQKDDSILEKQASEKLIVLRARRQEISDMLKHCSNSCHKRPWYRVKAR